MLPKIYTDILFEYIFGKIKYQWISYFIISPLVRVMGIRFGTLLCEIYTMQ